MPVTLYGISQDGLSTSPVTTRADNRMEDGDCVSSSVNVYVTWKVNSLHVKDRKTIIHMSRVYVLYKTANSFTAYKPVLN